MQQVAVAYQFEFLLDRALEMNRGIPRESSASRRCASAWHHCSI